MRKSLLPVAAILGWSVALAAVSSLEAMDAERDGQSAPEKIAIVDADLGQNMEAERDDTLSAAE